MKQTTGSSQSSTQATALLGHWAQVCGDYLRRLSARYPGAPARLLESIDYSLLAAGKRLRPALVLECWRTCASSHATPTPTAPTPTALAAAGALELVHTFSLVHDDLPAMDDDDLRRGVPTNHKVFGEAMAILAGDAMVTMAFEILAVDADPATVPLLVRELAAATGPVGMIGGQVIDMDLTKPTDSLEALQTMHRMKTGALLTASCRMGAIAAGASAAHLARLNEYGQHLGLAFQIVDDLLDQTATPQQLGKATGKDAAKGKVTYPMLLGMDRAREEAAHQLKMALDAVSGFGHEAEGLRSLARFVVERNV